MKTSKIYAKHTFAKLVALLFFLSFAFKAFAGEQFIGGQINGLSQNSMLRSENLFLKTGNWLDLKSPVLVDEPFTLSNKYPKTEMINDLSRWINRNNDQVAPGIEDPSNVFNSSNGRVLCSIAAQCGENSSNYLEVPLSSYSITNDDGKKAIRYTLRRFQSVGLHVRYNQNDISVCTFVVVSSGWIITAKHCISHSPMSTDVWLLMTEDNIKNEKAHLKLSGCKNSHSAPNPECTYYKLQISKDQLAEPWVDDSDLALIKLQKSTLPKSFNRNNFPTLDFSESRFNIVTLVGYGHTDIAGYRNRRPLVGWFRGDFEHLNNITFLEPSNYDTKPAPGDSGSPVFRGEYFGRDCVSIQSSKCKKYLLSGIVTGAANFKGTVSSTDDIKSSKTKIIRLSKYKDFICSHSVGSLGCQKK